MPLDPTIRESVSVRSSSYDEAAALALTDAPTATGAVRARVVSASDRRTGLEGRMGVDKLPPNSSEGSDAGGRRCPA
jgi:hypothetical protein